MTAFIIDTYNKYSADDRAAARYIFTMHDYPYAIKEYEVINGELQLPFSLDDHQYTFYQYTTLDEAKQYVRMIKRWE